MNERHHLHSPERSEIHTGDPEVVQDFLSESYGTTVRVDHPHGAGEGLNYKHTRTAVGVFATEVISQRGSVRTSADRLEPAVIYLPDSGHVECHASGEIAVAGPGQMVLAQCTDGRVETRTSDVQLRSVVLDQYLLLDAALSSAAAIRFTAQHPVDAVAARVFRQTAAFVQDSVLSDGTKATPLVIGAAGRLLASTALAAFANTAVRDTDAVTGAVENTPAALRRAVGFVEENADKDIGITDIAASVYLTPRSVQYIFRRYLDTTPTEFLRRVRLERAHSDLTAADKSTTTVAGTAAHWGFAHTGRFAVLYRQAFGESPHETLSSGNQRPSTSFRA